MHPCGSMPGRCRAQALELVVRVKFEVVVKGRVLLPRPHQRGPHKAAVVLGAAEVALALDAAVVLAHGFVVLRWGGGEGQEKEERTGW